MKDLSPLGFKVWVQERLEEGPLYGLWEFPGGKIEANETPEIAARREVLEEVEIEIPKHSPLPIFKLQSYSSETKNICLYVFLSPFDQLPAEKGKWLEIDYVHKSTPYQGQIPPINHVILDELAVYIQSQFNAGMINFLWKT